MGSIELTVHEGVALLTLNRPDVHNVINRETMIQWDRQLDRIAEDSSIHAILLTGSGEKTFCAGGDLKWFTHLTEEKEVRDMSEQMQKLLNRMYEGHLPVIGVLNGSAYGGGCEVLTACHYRIAAEDVSFQFRQSAMGVVTGWGGGLRLLHQLGRSRALELLLGGDRIDAQKALAMGLVDRVVPRSELMNAAVAFASMIAGRSPESIKSFLELARFAEHNDTEATRRRETDLFVSCWQGPWFRNAVDSFLHKRKKS